HAPQVSGVGGGAPSSQTFVQALFTLLLNRPASADDLNRFTNSVLPQSGRDGATMFVLGSPEYRSNAVRAFYQVELRRQPAPTDAEVAGWVNSKLGVWAIEVAFESSYEFAYPRGLSPAL